MLWMLLPLLATAILLEFYFGRYKEEKLGWNTAFGNALVLIFVSIDLFRQTYEPLGITIREALFSGDAKITISIVLMCVGLLLLIINFFHFLPERVAYAFSNPIYINVIGLLGIIIVYSKNIPLDWTTLAASITILLLFTGLTYLIYLIVPSYHPPIQRIIDEPNNKKRDKKTEAKVIKTKSAEKKPDLNDLNEDT